MKKLTLAIAILLSSVVSINAQDSNHEFKLFYSNGGTGDVSNIFSDGIGGAISGALSGVQSKQMYHESKSFGMVGLGYYYNINRLKIGLDLAFSPTTSSLFVKQGDKTPFRSTKTYHFAALPTAQFTYWKNEYFDIYGGVSAGLLASHSIFEDNSNTKKEKTPSKPAKAKDTKKTSEPTKASDDSSNSFGFAYQVTPIGVRVGNERIGAFVEAGYGTKGIVSAGVSLKF